MRTMAIMLLGLALVLRAAGVVGAEPERVDAGATLARPAVCERLGDGATVEDAGPARARRGQVAAPGEDRLQARKAEMVRRMFWIMLAHR